MTLNDLIEFAQKAQIDSSKLKLTICHSRDYENTERVTDAQIQINILIDNEDSSEPELVLHYD